MKHLLKAVVVLVVVMIVLMAIHVFCNIKGIELNTLMTGPMSAILAMWLYHMLTKNERK